MACGGRTAQSGAIRSVALHTAPYPDMPPKYYEMCPNPKHANGEPREPIRCQLGTRHEAPPAYPTAAVVVMDFLREDARAMHEGAGKETIADTQGAENMETAGAAVSFALISRRVNPTLPIVYPHGSTSTYSTFDAGLISAYCCSYHRALRVQA